ncbi:MAG: DUF4876 domain-containing protein [Tannerellaceae bacterium]|jgi:hypothetical protein|nr:DUF4876 domain-containing protein [Tannerellaceae bacterium]
MLKQTALLLAMAATMFVASSCGDDDDDDDVAKNYSVTVTLVAPDGIAVDITNLKTVAVNTTTGIETTLTDLNGDGLPAEAILPAGEYDFRASGTSESGDFKLNGLTSASVYEDKNVSIDLNIVSGGGLIFKEIYYAGVMSYYWKDGFFELYNNSDEVQYLDGLIVGIVDGGFGAPSPWADESGALPSRYPMTNHTIYFPGSGSEYPVQPGEGVVVATVAINHSARTLTDEDDPSPVDLSHADWNIYIPAQASDVEVAGIPNTLVAFSTWGLDFMPGVNGASLILAKLPEGTSVPDFVDNPDNHQKVPGGTMWDQLMIPHEYVIDGVDIVYAEEGQQYKRLLSSEDVGMAWVYGEKPGDSSAYTGKSLRRKVIAVTTEGKTVYKDTNNSSEDFIIGGGTPTPGVHPSEIDK